MAKICNSIFTMLSFVLYANVHIMWQTHIFFFHDALWFTFLAEISVSFPTVCLQKDLNCCKLYFLHYTVCIQKKISYFYIHDNTFVFYLLGVYQI